MLVSFPLSKTVTKNGTYLFSFLEDCCPVILELWKKESKLINWAIMITVTNYRVSKMKLKIDYGLIRISHNVFAFNNLKNFLVKQKFN